MRTYVQNQSLADRSRPFQGRDTGSNPVGDATQKRSIIQRIRKFFHRRAVRRRLFRECRRVQYSAK